jgi:hypothetical protein
MQLLCRVVERLIPVYRVECVRGAFKSASNPRQLSGNLHAQNQSTPFSTELHQSAPTKKLISNAEPKKQPEATPAHEGGGIEL